jgi:hypothetical protein
VYSISERVVSGLAIMNRHFLDYYRCPQSYAAFQVFGELSEDAGFFRWGLDTVCYGRTTSGVRANRADSASYDAQNDLDVRDSQVCLPFDAEEVIENLQRERYSAHFREPGSFSHALLRKTYYFMRPYLSVPLRKHLQKIHLRKWRQISFPMWPVDCTVDRIQRKLMALTMRAHGIDKMPFIWFWPDRHKSCLIITHDVEAPEGKEFCRHLMDMDEAFGFRSSFQVVPEERYPVSRNYLDEIADRGFEVNVHDLKHDGRLFAEYNEFLRRAKRINEYRREFGASGFRAGALYRNADWYDAFDFQYDMSIPNVAHLDPQRGGCCTVIPYFIGKMVEIPVTCTQDYTLIHILRDYSLDLWKKQVDLIRERHGLISVLVHPDYVIEPRAQEMCRSLLAYLAEQRDTHYIWSPLPREVAEWWQQRNQMELVCDDGQWRVEGPGAERATVAYAYATGDDVTYSFSNEADTAAFLEGTPFTLQTPSRNQ